MTQYFILDNIRCATSDIDDLPPLCPVNGDFETGTSEGWSTIQNGTLINEVVVGASHSGNYGLHLEAESHAPYESNGVSIFSSKLPIYSNIISFWIQVLDYQSPSTEGWGSSGFSISCTDDTINTLYDISVDYNPEDGTDWVYVEKIFSTPISNLDTKLRIQIYADGDYYNNSLYFTTNICIDDIEIHQTDVAPTASFTVNTNNGEPTLTVYFTDKSTYEPTSWNWDWDDGTAHGTTQNPSHDFTEEGTYHVVLTATNSIGSDVSDPVEIVVAWHPVVASFTVDKTVGASHALVQFTDTSNESPIAWSWDFTNGASSDLQNPTHDFTEVGSYNVVLTATNIHGFGVSSATTITVREPIEYPILNGGFETGDLTSWSQDGTGSVQSTITYSGDYAAMCHDQSGSLCGIGQQIHIEAGMVIRSRLYREPSTWGSLGLYLGTSLHNFTVACGSYSTYEPISVWGLIQYVVTASDITTFGNTAWLQLVAHGDYDCHQTGYFDDVSISWADYKPEVSFTTDKNTINYIGDVQFTDTSTEYPTSWSWNFGDESTSSSQHPLHTFTGEGVYHVVLTVTNIAGSIVSEPYDITVTSNYEKKLTCLYDIKVAKTITSSYYVRMISTTFTSLYRTYKYFINPGFETGTIYGWTWELQVWGYCEIYSIGGHTGSYFCNLMSSGYEHLPASVSQVISPCLSVSGWFGNVNTLGSNMPTVIFAVSDNHGGYVSTTWTGHLSSYVKKTLDTHLLDINDDWTVRITNTGATSSSIDLDDFTCIQKISKQLISVYDIWTRKRIISRYNIDRLSIPQITNVQYSTTMTATNISLPVHSITVTTKDIPGIITITWSNGHEETIITG